MRVDTMTKKPKMILEISKEYWSILRSELGDFDEKDGVLVATIQPSYHSPIYHSTDDIPNIEEFLQKRKREYLEEEAQRDAVHSTIKNILGKYNVDFSINPKDEYSKWLNQGAGKILKTTALPSILFESEERFWGYVFNMYLEKDIDFVPDTISCRDAFIIVLVLEIGIYGMGECEFYKILRAKLGIPYDWENMTLSQKMINDLCKSIPFP
jgi:hypothetical protein